MTTRTPSDVDMLEASEFQEVENEEILKGIIEPLDTLKVHFRLFFFHFVAYLFFIGERSVRSMQNFSYWCRRIRL